MVRLLTFNVNSLHRLLNHPLHHILKQLQTQFQPSETVATTASAAADSSQAAALRHSPPLELPSSSPEADYDADFIGTNSSISATDPFDDDERFALRGIDEDGSTTAAAALTAQTAAAASSTVAVPSVSSDSLPMKSAQPRTQVEVDALESSVAAAHRERLAHAQSHSSLGGSVATRLSALLAGLNADIICFQEVKMARSRIPEAMAIVDGWHAFFSFSRRKQGYSGVATYVRKASATPIRAEEGFTGMLQSSSTTTVPTYTPISSSCIGEHTSLYTEFDPTVLREIDSEGRCVVTDHDRFVLFNCYFPNASLENEARSEYKMTFNRAIQMRCEALVRSGRNVIIVGDVNACHQRIDHADFSDFYKGKRHAAGVNAIRKNTNATSNKPDEDGATEEPTPPPATFEEHPSRHWLHKFLVPGGGMFVDVFRHFAPTRPNAYTCWNTKIGARLTNYGTRIDYILANRELVESGFFTRCELRPDVHCSDHCPVEADLNVVTLCDDSQRAPPPLCSRFMPEFSGAQQSIANFFGKGAATTGAKSPMRDITATAVLSTTSSPSSSAPPSPTSRATLKRPLSSPTTSSPSRVALPPASKRQKNAATGGVGGKGKKGTSAATNSMSLHSFFGASTTTKKASTLASPSATQQWASSVDTPPAGTSPAQSPLASVQSLVVSSALDSPPSTFASIGGRSASVSSAQSAVAWKQLLDQKTTEVLCDKHNLRCKLLQSKKPGPNYGRSFYGCALVPPDRCDFFQWQTSAAANSKHNGRR